ncbi:hypothetical protein JCM5353_004252 [Sporobolomyces roseus]
MPSQSSEDDYLDSYSSSEQHLPNPTSSSSLSSISPLSSRSLSAISNLARYRPPPPLTRDTAEFEQDGHYGRAAVLVCLFGNRSGENLNVLLTTRAKSLRTFPGQVALPGGKMDPTDMNLEATARREAFEEVGLPIDTTRIRYLCTLPPLLMRNLTLVTPVVVLILDYSLKPELSKEEVEDVFSFPLEGFLLSYPRPPIFPRPVPSDAPPYHSFEDYKWYDDKDYRFHSFELGTHKRPRGEAITGVTAEILIQIARIAYEREPEFEMKAKGQMDGRELGEVARRDRRWKESRKEQREREEGREKERKRLEQDEKREKKLLPGKL